MVKIFNEYPETDILIEGHTDDVGSDAANMLLSQRRADTVKAFLVAQGITASRLDASGKGEAAPLASNISADGRQQKLAAVHPNQHPRAGLYWLVNFLSANGIGLLAGQAVITGSYAGVLDLPFGEDIQFQYGDWGKFRLRFVTKTS